MKKLFLLSLIAGALISTTSVAQGPSTRQQSATPPTAEQVAKMIQEAKATQVPLMVEKTGLTKAQADRVIEVNYEVRLEAATLLNGVSEADRPAKLAEIKALKEKKYSEIPLTADQIKAVYAFYADMGKNSERRVRN